MLNYIFVVLATNNFIVAFEHGVINYCDDYYMNLCRNKGIHVGCQFPEVWDEELATLAQRLADQCHFVHDDCRATTLYPFAGQTVGEARWRTPSMSDDISTHLIESLRKIIDAWWSEKNYVTALELMQPFKLYRSPPPWGHFSQLAVWSLRAVGCGAVYYGPTIRLLFVCDFSHTNMLGQRTLKPGPLVPCPEDMERNNSPYPLLCAPKQKEQEELINLEAQNEAYLTEDSQYLYIDTTVSEPENLKIYSTTQYIYLKFHVVNLTTNFERNTNEITTENHDSRGRWIWREKQEISIPTAKSRVESSQFYNRERNHHNQDQIREEGIRLKWHQTSTRSRRPGFEARLNTEYYPQLRPSVATRMVAMKMDDEIAEQLFKDTGFKIKNKSLN